MDFITVKQAFEIIESQIPKPTKIVLPLLEAKGSFLATDKLAPIDVPTFDNAAMDGFAIKWNDWNENKSIKNAGFIKAGDTKNYLLSDQEALKIFTGAPIPQGADTVVMKEWIIENEETLRFLEKPIKKGDHIRLKGSQTEKGQLILTKDTQINSGVISFLSTFGITHVEVYQKPKISLVISGDELVPQGEPLQFGQIYESNGITLTSLLGDLGIKVEMILFPKDDFNATKNCIDQALTYSDIVLVTGGISVGDFDFVQSALEALSVEKLFYKLQQKPGKPMYFGKKNNQFVFALPGNPAAVFSCFHAYVKPVVAKWMQPQKSFLKFSQAIAAESYRKKSGLTHWVKAIVKDQKIHFLSGQESYKMDAFAQANALVCLPSEIEFVEGGTTLDFLYI